MDVFLIILAAIILILFYMFIEAGWLKVSKVEFTKSSSGLKVMHISDVHMRLLRVSANRVKKVVKKENPDIIIFSGDYVERPVDASVFLDFLQKVKLSGKTYLCLGNHDYRAYAKNPEGLKNFINEIKSLNVEVLINSSVQIQKNNFVYNIIGIDDLRTGKPDVATALKGCSPAAVKIVFSHNPDIALSLSRSQVDYLFCGHFHGGQIWMPFNLEFILLRKDELCRKGYKRGLHKINGINVYLNKGLGNVLVPFRFFSRPEISIYKIP